MLPTAADCGHCDAGASLSYAVFREGNFIAQTADRAVGYTDSGLTNGLQYSYRVVAVVNGGYAGWSVEAMATPTP